LWVVDVWDAATEETDEERARRLDAEQAKLDRENGKLEYYAAITDECNLSSALVYTHLFHCCSYTRQL